MFSRFCTVLAYEWQTDRHTMTAYTTLPWRVAVKTDIRIKPWSKTQENRIPHCSTDEIVARCCKTSFCEKNRLSLIRIADSFQQMLSKRTDSACVERNTVSFWTSDQLASQSRVEQMDSEMRRRIHSRGNPNSSVQSSVSVSVLSRHARQLNVIARTRSINRRKESLRWPGSCRCRRWISMRPAGLSDR